MKRFEVGDAVRVIDGPRKGVLTTVLSPLRPARLCDASMAVSPGVQGQPVHSLNLVPDTPGAGAVVAPPAWLEHLHDSRDRGAWDELTLRLCKPRKVTGPAVW